MGSKDCSERSRKLLFPETLEQLYHHVNVNDASDKEWMDNARINLQILQRQLSLKVEHCGNMDFVEYLPNTGNKLVKICEDICNDSICQTVTKDLGITGVRIHRVTKVTNNETNIFRSSIYYNENINQDKRESDFLFKFLVKPIGVVALQQWPFDVFEQAFFDTKVVVTSDCLAAADADWIKRTSLRRRSSQTALCSSSEHRLAILVQLPSSEFLARVEKPDDYHAMYAGYNKDTCQCLSIVKTEEVMPVFAVEYEYIFQNGSENNALNEKLCSIVAATDPLNSCPHLNLENLGHCFNLTELKIHKLRVIDLSGRGICTIDLKISLPNLRELYLSYNKLTNLPDSAMLKYIRKLDVSFNDIQSFKTTTGLPLLEDLNLAWNLNVGFIPILQVLKNFTPNLTTLNLKYNPFTDVTEMDSMLSLAHDAMPSLKYFNENTMAISVQSRPVNRFQWLIDIFEKADSSKFKLIRNTKANLISEINKSSTTRLSIVGEELNDVQYINLSHNYLNGIKFIKEFPELKEFYFENNLLTKIYLEESANHLTKLSLSNNFIMSLDGLTQGNLPVLNYLDLCNNLITSLIAMGNFHSLTQFYCSHNNISEIQEIHNLKNWHELKIVDLSNNPMNSISLCDEFIIFHIPKVEYVGGKCVTASEILKANQSFGGCLDKDTIINMYNLRDLTHIKQLSIVKCAMKKVNLTADILPNLKSLDLSRNQITTLWGLHTLKKLQVLCLSHNRVQTSAPGVRQDFIMSECLFPSLNTLFLDYNGIRSLVDLNLHNMPALKYLYLQHNELQDVNGLQNCRNLETLVLDNNKIHMITEEDFHKENNIKSLFLENNRIKYFSFARCLSKINKLFLSNNKVANKDQLKYFQKLEHLKEITILGNPLCKRTNHYKLAIQTLDTLTHIDGHSVILKEYSDT